jgi:hypothetical protein
MSSRAKALNKPFWKRRTKSPPAYHRQYAYDKDGLPIMNEGHYVTKLQDGTLEYDRTEQVYRDAPNRALTRKVYSQMKKENK